jgi:hypothetical protein
VLQRIALALITGGLAGCGGATEAAGPADPAGAVARFLSVTSVKVDQGGDEQQAKQRVEADWRRLCTAIDPQLRSLRFYEDQPASAMNCGAAVAALTFYTGDTGPIAAPRTISGRPLSARVAGDTAIVKTAVRYAPGSPATVNVLVVKRGDEWWLATPQALNPRLAAKGGLSDAALRTEYGRLRTASRH